MFFANILKSAKKTNAKDLISIVYVDLDTPKKRIPEVNIKKRAGLLRKTAPFSPINITNKED